MEDNEFEEVTIISHTDQAASILPQQTAERLMKEIRMEVTQKISPTENIKYGSSQHSAASTELDQLKERFLETVAPTADHLEAFVWLHRVPGAKDYQYLLGTEGKAYLVDGQGDHKSFETGSTVISMAYWREYFLVRMENNKVRILDHQLQQVTSTQASSGETKNCHFNAMADYFYFETDGPGIVRVDRSLKETLLFEDRLVQDFFVCPKTEAITTLDRINCLKRDGFCLKLELDNRNRSAIHILKKMYSDHFLVGGVMKLYDLNSLVLRLVDSNTLVQIDRLEREDKRYWVQDEISIRLLAPRQGINCFLVLASELIELFCEYRLKLYHLKTLEINHGTDVEIWCLSHQIDDSWMIGCDRCTIYSFRVIFPPSLHY